jgi:hypothetical protein
MTERRKPGFIAIRHAGKGRLPPPFVVKFKRASEWTTSGKAKLKKEVRGYLEKLSKLTEFDTIYGVGGIGLHWLAYKMHKLGGRPILMLDWQDDISSARSYKEFQTIADLIP